MLQTYVYQTCETRHSPPTTSTETPTPQPRSILSLLGLYEVLYLSLSFLLCFLDCSAQGQLLNNTIRLGSSIVAGYSESWGSPSGDFAFGFYRLVDGRYLVGIWFDTIPERTLVWSANRDNPALVNSTISLKASGQLVLIHANRTEFSIYGHTDAHSALMLDNGNFVLQDSSSKPAWQSFDHPTDTLLPGQVLPMGQQLYSNANATVDYSTGRYMLDVANDGNILMTAFRYADPAHNYTGTTGNKNTTIVFNESTAIMYVVNGTTIIYNMTTQLPVSPIKDYYHRATLNDQGNFQQLFRHKQNGSGWSMVWQVIQSPCKVNNICGVFGFCTSVGNQKANCECLEGYSPIDPNIPSKGCHPNVAVDFCAPNSSNLDFKIIRLENADFPFLKDSDVAMVGPVDATKCEDAVRNDCFSTAAICFNNGCYKKRMPLLNARRSIPETNNLVAFLKVPIINGQEVHKHRSPKYVVLLVIFILCSTLTVLFAVVVLYYHPIARPCFHRQKAAKLKQVEVNLKAFSFNELREATNGFKNQLVRGAFGTVYSGVLTSGDEQVEVAVKRLEKFVEQGEKEFITEVQVIGLTHHKNLVRLLGFCDEPDHRLLVYELMQNGPLSTYIFGEGENQKPRWESRVEIVWQIARGLSYLHEECETQIIHFDIKPENILLDHTYAAKISDFGVAKLMTKGQSRTETMLIRGTRGYMAPEWLKNAPITTKVDVYSFGVMLLEIIFCRRHVKLHQTEEEIQDDDPMLVDWVISCARAGGLNTIISNDSEALSDYRRFERMILVALWCICPNPAVRPSMKKVLLMLEGTAEVGIPPLLGREAS